MAKAQLRNLRIKRVAVVPMGANYDKSTGDGAHIMLFKSAGPNVGDVHVDSGGSTHWEDAQTDCETDYEKANLDADSRKALPDSAFAAVWTDDKGNKRRKLPIHDAGHLTAARGRIDQADIPANVKAEARRKIEAATHRSRNKENPVKKSWIAKMIGLATEPDAAKRADLVAKAAADLADDDDDDVTKMHKADDPMCKCADCMVKRRNKSAEDVMKDAVSKAVEAAVKAATEPLQKALSDEVDKRELGEVRAILKSFAATPFDLTEDKDTKTYLALKKSNPAAFDSIMAQFRAQDTIIAKSAAFGDIGTRRGAGEGSAWAQIEAKAEAFIQKSGEKMSKEAAIEIVMNENPDLVRQYRNQTM